MYTKNVNWSVWRTCIPCNKRYANFKWLNNLDGSIVSIYNAKSSRLNYHRRRVLFFFLFSMHLLIGICSSISLMSDDENHYCQLNFEWKWKWKWIVTSFYDFGKSSILCVRMGGNLNTVHGLAICISVWAIMKITNWNECCCCCCYWVS